MVRKRMEVPDKEKWNVEALYVSSQAWLEDFKKAQGRETTPRWPSLQAYQGRLCESPEVLAKFLEEQLKLDRTLAKLYTYAHLRLDEDLANDANKDLFGRMTALLHEFQLEYSWVEPELLDLDEKKYQTFIEHPALKPYHFFLQKIWRMKPHVLSKELEGLFALSGKAMAAPHKAFGALENADLTFAPAVNSQGESQELTTGTYQLYLRDEDRALRKSAFENLHKGYEAHVNTLCELIQGQVQAHLFNARARHFSDCREAALFPRRVDAQVYDNLISTIHQNLDAMHEYIALRKEYLKLSELHAYDLYLPLIQESNAQISYADACKLVVESVALLGKEYTATLQKGLIQDRWVDPFENQYKRSGAYSSGCYDSMPYILMNYHGTLRDVLTLAHEAGHSMHSWLSRKNQPYLYADYPIFVAEVASTFNEQMLLNLLKQRSKTLQDKAYLIQYEIEAIRTTIFRQTMFAEFELQLHRWAEQGTPFTPSLLKSAYLDLNRAYYGSELVLDHGLAFEWARIPHFYYNFYVYQYATGLSAAMALFDQASASPAAVNRYLQFLSSGGSQYPLDLLQIAGVDLRTGTAVQAAMDRFRELLVELRDVLYQLRSSETVQVEHE